ncbi:MAG TPA: helix-turn-helix domain-containing protein [Jatrophihabitantaceae bacterium]|nr:helix-turn-helix domain-containing protein [Jatrophihabitantaceae bacterium]
MPADLEQQILNFLQAMKIDDRPATLGDLARRFGASKDVISRCARHMVDGGLAQPSMMTIHDTSKLHGLLPQPVVRTP